MVYTSCLNATEIFYLVPFEKNNQFCSREDVRVIFSNFRAIKDLHDNFEKELKISNGNLRDIAKAFQKNMDFFKVYVEYCNNFPQAVQLLVEKERGRKDFQHFLEQQREASNMGGLDLASVLAMPVSRLPRYLLLLRELQNNNVKVKELHKAVTRLEKLVEKISDAKRRAEDIERILVLQKRLGGTWNVILLQPKRRLLLEFGPCFVTGKRCLIFAFSDMVLCCVELSNEMGGPLSYLVHSVIDGHTDLLQNGKEVTVNRGEILIDFQSLDEANTFARIVQFQIQSFRQHGEVESYIDDSDAVAPISWEGWLDKMSNKKESIRFLPRFVQLRGNTLFWFEQQHTTESPGAPTGSYCVANKMVTNGEKDKVNLLFILFLCL